MPDSYLTTVQECRFSSSCGLKINVAAKMSFDNKCMTSHERDPGGAAQHGSSRDSTTKEITCSRVQFLEPVGH